MVMGEIIPALVLVLVSGIILHIVRRRRSKKKHNLPPGPKSWPIVGNLLQMGSLPHRTLQELAKQYGPIMHLRFGSSPVVVASTAEMAKQFLHDHDINFANRPRYTAGKLTGYNWSNMTWSPYGPYWRQARRIYAAELLSPDRIAAYEHIREEERMSLIRNLYASAGKPVKLRELLFTANLNIIFRILFGKSMSEFFSKTSPAELGGLVEELFLLNGVLNIGDHIPWLAPFDLQGYNKRMKGLNSKLDRLFEYAIDVHNERRRVEGKDWVPADILDVLLQLSDDHNLECKLGRDNVKAFISEFITGSTDTTTVTLEWAISELSRSPSFFSDATKEMDIVIGMERWVRENDIQQLTQVEAIMKETMRMHPISPLLHHATKEKCTIDGYDILSNTSAFINVWAIGMDPKNWKSPSKFNPKRFIGSMLDVKGKYFELLPFGSGRRMCPGINLGLKMVQTTLANMIHGFHWMLPSGFKAEDLDMDEIFGLTSSKKIPLEVIVIPRLPKNLYM